MATDLEVVSEALNDLFHVLISEFDRDPMDLVENYLPWTAEQKMRLALRDAYTENDRWRTSYNVTREIADDNIAEVERLNGRTNG